MGKTYIDSVKYVIYAKFQVEGTVEKPDVIGALFGQTEGLLGEELDLRELQKMGRIGRVEVEIFHKGGKSQGTIRIPTSLDMIETAVIAAAVETVDRIGPYPAKVMVERIEDTRAAKRQFIINRAKELLQRMLAEEIPETREIIEAVKAAFRTSRLVEYGPEKLPAGPGIEDSEEIIVVEGRADVLNLLKHGIDNVIAINGARIPKTIVDLSRKKKITLFIDGDRGGEMIARQMLQAAKVDFIARAPDGKEVEELTQKEILKALRNKIPATEFFRKAVEGVPRKYIEILSNLKGTLKAVILDEEDNVLAEVPVRELLETLGKLDGARAVIFDGVITQRLLDVAKNKDVKYLIGVRKGELEGVPEDMVVVGI